VRVGYLVSSHDMHEESSNAAFAILRLVTRSIFVVLEIGSSCYSYFLFTCLGVGLASHVLNASFQGMIHTSAFCAAVAAGAVASRVQQMDSLGIASEVETLMFHRSSSNVDWYDKIETLRIAIFHLSVF